MAEGVADRISACMLLVTAHAKSATEWKRILVIVSRHIQSISDITDRVFPEIKRKITTRL